jgi:hypothetical protein
VAEGDADCWNGPRATAGTGTAMGVRRAWGHRERGRVGFSASGARAVSPRGGGGSSVVVAACAGAGVVTGVGRRGAY